MIERPRPFDEAVEYIKSKESLLGLDKSDYNYQLFLRAKEFLLDTLSGATEKVISPTDGIERVALRGGGRGTFVRRMREFMVKEGMVSGEEEFMNVNQNDITDIRSEDCLRLIYDTNIRQAYGYGQWKQGQHPAILRRYPAQKLVCDRVDEREHPRVLENVGAIRLKKDSFWADHLNDPAIGGFGVPFPPFGFYSGMGVRDVSREDAIELGLDVGEIKPIPGELNSNLQSSVKNMEPDIKQKLIDALRSFKGKDAKKSGAEAALRVQERNGMILPE